MKKWLFSATALIFAGIAPCYAVSYSPGVVAGKALYVSGQLPIDPNTGMIVDGDITTLTNLTMSHIQQIVLQKGFAMKNVVKTVVYLRDIRDYAQMDKAYATWFPFSTPPARDVIVVPELPNNAGIQISCVASKEKTTEECGWFWE